MAKDNKLILMACIIGACVMSAAISIGWGLAHFKSGVEHEISATGSSSMNFESDLVVWRGDFSAKAETSEEAYKQLNQKQF